MSTMMIIVLVFDLVACLMNSSLFILFKLEKYLKE